VRLDLLIVVLLVLVGLGASGTASALAAPSAPRIGAWHRVATGDAHGVTTDGTRYAATRLTQTRLRIDDTATGRHRILTSPSCVNAARGIGPGTPAFLLGSGLVVWQCPDRFIDHRQIWIDDIRTGARTQPRGLAALWAGENNSSDGATFTVVGVGRHWLYAIRTGYHYSDDILVGVHTPRVIHSPADRADVTAAPDTTAGVVPLCAGIRRTPGDLDIGRLAFSPLHYDEPYAVSTSGHLRACHGAPAPPAGRPVVQLGGGLITWSRTTRVYAQSVTTGRRSSRRAPGRVISVSHTRHAIYIATASHRSYRASALFSGRGAPPASRPDPQLRARFLRTSARPWVANPRNAGADIRWRTPPARASGKRSRRRGCHGREAQGGHQRGSAGEGSDAGFGSADLRRPGA
jgi:hypothetical protein